MFTTTSREAATVQTVEELGDEIASLAAQISAATCRWLGLVARFDERQGWAQTGAASCAAWVSWRCGVAPVTAREHVRVAHRLGELPLIREAFARGELSYSKARALTRVEGIREESELLDLARHADATQLERIVAAFRGVTRTDSDRAYAARSLDLIHDADGTLLIRGRLPADLGAVLVAALQAAEHQLHEDNLDTPGADAFHSPGCARRADALLLLVRAATGEQPSAQLASASLQVSVHVDASSLTEGADANRDPDMDAPTPGSPAPLAEIENGPALAVETVRRLCCDAGIVPVVRGTDGEVLSVGRRTRSIPPSIRRALVVRDAGCRFPGCGRTRWLQAHHIEHWAHGGPTALPNLILLCQHHHQCVHEGGWRLIIGGDGLTCDALAPNGHQVCAVPPSPPPSWPSTRSSLPVGGAPDGRPGPPPGPHSLCPRRADAPWDLGMAVDALLSWTESLPAAAPAAARAAARAAAGA